MTSNNLSCGITRRTLLKTTTGSLGVTLVGRSAAQASNSQRAGTDSAQRTRLPEQSHNGAIEWASNAFWTATGTAIEFPGQVVFPEYSHLAITVTAETGGTVAGRDAALAVARLQDPSTGGFFRQQGDFLGPWTTATYHAVSLARMFDISIDESAATEFLLDHQNDAGGFAPRSGFLGGQTISTFEATYKSTVALHRLDALTQTARDRIVAFVRSEQHADGGWPSTPRAKDSTVRGTYYAISVLLFLDALDSKTAKKAGTFLRTLQRPMGGFRGQSQQAVCSSAICRERPEVTTRTTAQALLALSRIDRALHPDAMGLHTDWLEDRQLHHPNDGRFRGGFETYQGDRAPVINYLLNTVFALNALRSLNAFDRIDRASALGFIAACQHPGSGGFAPWPSSFSSLVDTEAAARSLDLLGATDRIPRAGLARTLAGQQRSNGAIAQLDWDSTPTVSQTAHALLALNRVDRLNVVDRTAAAEFIADHQRTSGGFTDTRSKSDRGDTISSQGVRPSVEVTWLAVRAVAAANARSSTDLPSVASYFSGLQGKSGHISSERPETSTAVRDTRCALESLATIDRLSAVNVDKAVSYLATRQNEDGTYASENEAVHVTIGLAAADAINRIDRSSTRRYLRRQQTPDGGFAKKGFYTGNTAMQRHAGAIEALHALNGS